MGLRTEKLGESLQTCNLTQETGATQGSLTSRMSPRRSTFPPHFVLPSRGSHGLGVHCKPTSWLASALEIESRCLGLASAPAGSVSSCFPLPSEHTLTNLTVIVPRIIRHRATYVRREDGNYFRDTAPTLKGFRFSMNQFCKGLA